MRTKVLNTTWRWASRILALILVCIVAGALVILTVLPRAVHGAALTVLTGSMTPTIPVGSIVLDRPVDPGTLHVGDIATYQKTPGVADYITHRIIAINTKTDPVTFTFKGDANNAADIDPVPATAIRGKVWFHVPYIGAIRDSLHAKGGLALLGFIALIGYAVAQAIGLLRDHRRKNQTLNAGPNADDVTSTSTDDAGSPGAATGEPAIGNSTSLDTHTFTATFRAGQQGRLSRDSVSWLLGGKVTAEDDASFTVMVTEPTEIARRTSVLLETLEPINVDGLAAVYRMPMGQADDTTAGDLVSAATSADA